MLSLSLLEALHTKESCKVRFLVDCVVVFSVQLGDFGEEEEGGGRPSTTNPIIAGHPVVSAARKVKRNFFVFCCTAPSIFGGEKSSPLWSSPDNFLAIYSSSYKPLVSSVFVQRAQFVAID